VNPQREAWFEGQLDLDPTRIVFIDETAANTKMARLYGRAPRGERCRAPVPHGHWKTTTFTAGLRHDGVAAPMVLDGRPASRPSAVFIGVGVHSAATFTEAAEGCGAPRMTTFDSLSLRRLRRLAPCA
jgi:hypothetical protein